MNTYEIDLGMQNTNTAYGVRKLIRLKEEHVKLTPRHCMKVKYAAQVH